MNSLTKGASSDENVIQRDKASPPLTSEDLKSRLGKIGEFRLSEHGDAAEKEFAQLNLDKLFPGYEKVWRSIITPATHRTVDNPADIRIRSDISDDLLLLCQFHYTILRALLRAWNHRKSNRDGRYFDFFCSMQNACEQVDAFLLMTGVVFEGKYDLEELLKKTSRFKSDIAKSDYLAMLKTPIDKPYKDAAGQIGAIRNALVHGPEIATYLPTDGGSEKLPNINMHKKLLWTDLPASDQNSLKLYFSDPAVITKGVFESYLQATNSLWEALLPNIDISSNEKAQSHYVRLK